MTANFTISETAISLVLPDCQLPSFNKYHPAGNDFNTAFKFLGRLTRFVAYKNSIFVQLMEELDVNQSGILTGLDLKPRCGKWESK